VSGSTVVIAHRPRSESSRTITSPICSTASGQSRSANPSTLIASYQTTPRIVRDATTMTLPADIEAALKAFLRERTGAFR
jgi:hypothetical protein